MTQGTDLHCQLEPETPVHCDCCDWTGHASELQPIVDIALRVYPGEVVPAGQCPECTSLAHVTEQPLVPPPANDSIIIGQWALDFVSLKADSAVLGWVKIAATLAISAGDPFKAADGAERLARVLRRRADEIERGVAPLVAEATGSTA